MHYLLDIHYSSISHNILSNTIATVYFPTSPSSKQPQKHGHRKDFRNQKPVRAGWTGSSHPPRGREQATLAAGAPNGSLGRAPRGAKWAILRISQGQNRKRHRGARPVALVRGRQRPGMRQMAGCPGPPPLLFVSVVVTFSVLAVSLFFLIASWRHMRTSCGSWSSRRYRPTASPARSAALWPAG